MSAANSLAMVENYLKMPTSRLKYHSPAMSRTSNYRVTSFKKANKPFDLRKTPAEWINVQNAMQYKTTDPKELRKMQKAQKGRNKEEVLGPIIEYDRRRNEDSPISNVHVNASVQKRTRERDFAKGVVGSMIAQAEDAGEAGAKAEFRVTSDPTAAQSTYPGSKFKRHGLSAAYLGMEGMNGGILAELESAFQSAGLGSALEMSWSNSDNDMDFWSGGGGVMSMDTFSHAFPNAFTGLSGLGYVEGAQSPEGRGTFSPETTTPTRKPSKRVVKPRKSYPLKRKFEEEQDPIVVGNRENDCSCNLCASCVSRSASKAKPYARSLPKVYSPILPKPLEEGKTKVQQPHQSSLLNMR